MLTWGLLSMAMILVRTPREFYLARLALGAAEAGFFPGIIFYLYQWFPAARRSQAISRFYVAIPLSSVVMGTLAGMLLNLNGRLSLAGWQWLFLVEGLPAIVMSVLFLLYLPDGPRQARWLKTDERNWILNQIRKEEDDASLANNDNRVGSAFREPRVWLLGSFLFCFYLGWYGVTFIMPSIIQTVTGFSTTRVGIAVALFGALGAASMLLSGWHSDRTCERYVHTLIPVVGMALAYLAVALSTRPAIVLSAFALLFIAGMAIQPPLWALPAAFLRGKSAAVGVAVINTMSILGGFIGPWWLGVAHDKTGTYQRGVLTLILPTLAACAFLLAARRCSKPPRAVLKNPQESPPSSPEPASAVPPSS
jgi:ACS family tartrate transporter-like MFS transporter